MAERPVRALELEMRHDDPEDQIQNEPDEPIIIPIEDTLDLHTFRPSEVKDLLNDYLEAASEKGFQEVVIIHGKGSGILREKVRSILRKHSQVESFGDSGVSHGGWGATSVRLLKKKSD